MSETTYSRPELESQLADAERRAEGLRLIIRGLDILDVETITTSGTGGHKNTNGAKPTASSDEAAVADGPRGRAAVRVLAAEHPGKTWTLRALVRELLRRGWTSSPDPVRAEHALGEAVRRLVKDGEAVRVRPGVYRFLNGQVVIK